MLRITLLSYCLQFEAFVHSATVRQMTAASVIMRNEVSKTVFEHAARKEDVV